MSGSDRALPDGELDPDAPELVAVLHPDSGGSSDSGSPRISLCAPGLLDDDPSHALAAAPTQPGSIDPANAAAAAVAADDDVLCVVCFERPPETTLEPCGHANLCLTCLSRLAKRRCPTCRARAKKVRVVQSGELVTRAVRDVIAERKKNELATLDGTLQVVFLGPPAVGKKTLVRKLLARFPLAHSATGEPGPGAPPPPAPAATLSAAGVPDGDDDDMAWKAAAAVPGDEEIFSDGTDFSGNAWIGGAAVRLSVLRRTSLASRRMMLDDVRVLKPDVLVLCCSAHVPASFDEMLAWDRVLRSGFARSRMWALLALDDADFGADQAALNLPSTIAAISPTELRPRGHYLCTPGSAFNIGFRQLAKDVISVARMARDEQYAATLAAEEARQLALQHAAGTLAEQSDAATRVIANNGIPLPSFPAFHVAAPHNPRPQTAAGRPADAVRAPFGMRVRARDTANTGGFSFAGLASWFSGASSDTQ